MDNEEIRAVPGEGDPGMSMHHAQEVIHAGRIAIKGLLVQEPVDSDALSAQRQVVNEARHEVKGLARQIRREREHSSLLRTGWIVRYHG